MHNDDYSQYLKILRRQKLFQVKEDVLCSNIVEI